MKLQSPKGHDIVGTLESIQGVAIMINEGVTDEGDHFEFDYEGTTDVQWDSQKTDLTVGGARIFVCDEGLTWAEDELVLVEEEGQE